jgi:hypothetical protein
MNTPDRKHRSALSDSHCTLSHGRPPMNTWCSPTGSLPTAVGSPKFTPDTNTTDWSRESSRAVAIMVDGACTGWVRGFKVGRERAVCVCEAAGKCPAAAKEGREGQ